MKIKISDKIRGKIRLTGVNGTYKAGNEITLTDEQFFETSVQDMVRSGLVIPLEEVKKKTEKHVELVNVSKHKIMFNSLLYPIHSGDTFIISAETFRNKEFKMALKDKQIVFKEEYAKYKKNLEKEEQKKNAPVVEVPENTIKRLDTLKNNIPEQYKPKEVGDEKIVVKTKAEVMGTKVEPKESEEIVFVDQQQEQEKVAKLSKHRIKRVADILE